MRHLRIFAIAAFCTALYSGCWLTNAEVAVKYDDPALTGDTGVDEDAISEE